MLGYRTEPQYIYTPTSQNIPSSNIIFSFSTSCEGLHFSISLMACERIRTAHSR